MSKYLYGLIVTPYGAAANNRGENEGNITTLQKILWNGETHTTVSAEAIRWAIRYYWQKKGIGVNRKWDGAKGVHEWADQGWSAWGNGPGDGAQATFIDDDVLGFMEARAGAEEGSDELEDKNEELEHIKTGLESANKEGDSEKVKELKKREKELKKEIKNAKKGSAIKRKGAMEVTRAISLTPFAGDITFNSKSGEKSRTSLYGTELHATRYQYAFAITPDSLRVKERIYNVIDAVVGLSEVGGNHSRFLYDFSPDAIVFRWTDDFAPRILYGFTHDGTVAGGGSSLAIPSIIEKMDAGDIDPGEVVVGGKVELGSYAGKVKAFPGVKAAADEVRARIKDYLTKGTNT